MNNRLHLCIVDPAPQSYLAFAGTAREQNVQVQFVESARAALRVNPIHEIDTWMISVQLAEISGYDLHDMLRDLFPTSMFVLVDEQHCEARERAARECGVKLYLCKPPQIWWLDLLAHPPPNAHAP